MLERLRAIQTREGLTDGQMAARLRCSRPLWNRVKNGHMLLSDDLAMRAAGAFPELTRDLLDRAEASVRTVTNTAKTAA